METRHYNQEGYHHPRGKFKPQHLFHDQRLCQHKNKIAEEQQTKAIRYF